MKAFCQVSTLISSPRLPLFFCSLSLSKPKHYLLSLTSQPPPQVLISLLPLLSLSPTLVQSQQSSSGYVTVFTTIDCAQAGEPPLERNETVLAPPGSCHRTPMFMSFQAGVAQSCPTGKLPKVTVFSGTACDGTSLDAGEIPLDHRDSKCTEFVASVAGPGLVSVGGNSAKFYCV